VEQVAADAAFGWRNPTGQRVRSAMPRNALGREFDKPWR